MSAVKHDIDHTTPWIIDRRQILGTLGAAAAVSLLPLSDATAASLIPRHSAPLLADWHIDDQWGPRYAEPIACRLTIPDNALADGWSAL
jgi:hypothetical protein